MHVSSLEGLIRNRSLAAFNQNPEDIQNNILKQIPNPGQYLKKGLPSFVYDSIEFQAVYPELITLKIKEKSSIENPEPISLINFVAFHPTVMGPKMELYSSDVFGVASQELKNLSGYGNTVISFINGADGDVSSNWYRQDKWNALKIGTDISERMYTACKLPGTIVGTRISNRYDIIPMGGQEVFIDINRDNFECDQERINKTSINPYPVLGDHVRNTALKSLRLMHPNIDKVILAGLSNDYLSYFTTPSEFNAQHYEGAFTVYGIVSGLYREQSIGRLAKRAQALPATEKESIIQDQNSKIGISKNAYLINGIGEKD